MNVFVTTDIKSQNHCQNLISDFKAKCISIIERNVFFLSSIYLQMRQLLWTGVNEQQTFNVVYFSPSDDVYSYLIKKKWSIN